MISSTLTIISAASVADKSTCCFTLKLSVIPNSVISPTCPFKTFTPMFVSPSACLALNCETISPESKPALSQIIDGMHLNALAKHSIASERFPGVFSASCSTALDMIISAHPPPQITRESLTAVFNTHNASCRERSASAKICVDAPLKTIVHASPFATPENLIKRSSPIIISSIKSHSPNFADSGVSNVLKISPPVTKANRSTPSKSACSIAATPASAKICSG
mmetsp:Transcript_17/g.59  ORF Transcript_17/g.59 Transcript_17/m.59 type:complete len:223 (+) Transcript_17:184-852(+)